MSFDNEEIFAPLALCEVQDSLVLCFTPFFLFLDYETTDNETNYEKKEEETFFEKQLASKFKRHCRVSTNNEGDFYIAKQVMPTKDCGIKRYQTQKKHPCVCVCLLVLRI